MFDDVKVLADQVGWPIATILFLLVIGDKLGILSIRVGKKKDVDERIDQLIVVVTELGLKVARIEAILEERRK